MVLPASISRYTSSVFFQPSDEDEQFRIERHYERELAADLVQANYYEPLELDISQIPSAISPATALFWRTLEANDPVSTNPFSGVALENPQIDEIVSDLNSVGATRGDSSETDLCSSQSDHVFGLIQEESLPEPSSNTTESSFVSREEHILVDPKIAKLLDEKLDDGFVYLQKNCLDPLEKFSKYEENDGPSYYVSRRLCLAKIGRLATRDEVMDYRRIQGKKIPQSKRKSTERSASLTRNRSFSRILSVIRLIPEPENSFLPIESARKLVKFARAINGIAEWFRIQTPWQYKNLYLFADLLSKADQERNTHFLKLIENSLPPEEFEKSKISQLRHVTRSKRCRPDEQALSSNSTITSGSKRARTSSKS